jgi:hypothetical protein
VAEPVVEGPAGCVYCGGVAEPEQDGDLTFHACADCGGAFGYRRVQRAGPVCAAGLPIQIESPQPVFLGTTIARRPE